MKIHTAFHWQNQRGVTLVEVLVVVTIIAALALLGIQFAAHWTNSSKVTQTHASLQQTYAVAKATALQNYKAQVRGSVAAVLCMGPKQISVVQGNDCTGTPVWTRPVADNVSIRFGTPASSSACIALSSAALPVASAGPLTCTTALNYSITAGSTNVSKNLY